MLAMKHHAPAEPVGEPAARERPDDGAGLDARGDQSEHRCRGLELLAHEHQHERDWSAAAGARSASIWDGARAPRETPGWLLLRAG